MALNLLMPFLSPLGYSIRWSVMNLLTVDGLGPTP
jgi:hypothetical protein